MRRIFACFKATLPREAESMSAQSCTSWAGSPGTGEILATAESASPGLWSASTWSTSTA
jgi:hypothetical protein